MALFGLLTLGANAQRVTDKLDRGIVAVPNGSGYLVSWRKFGSEYYDTQYNLYRNGTKIKSGLKASNFVDAGGTSSSTYAVEAVVRGVVQPKSAEVKAWAQAYYDVKVKPVVNRAGKTIGNSVAGNSGGNDTTTPGYTLNDVSLADVDGDGVCEFIVKRNNSQGNLRSASNKTDFNLYECYKIDGTRLWWIDLGPNLMAGADEQWDMIGFDWDEDGKAECLMRGADNMIIHTASGKSINIGNMTTGFTSSDRPEYMGVGNEYLLYLNGETGEPYGWNGEENWTPMAYPLPQFEANETYGDADVWGDLGHRMQKHYFGAPYLDGRHASIFLGRGCYTRHKFCALDVNPATHELTQRWRWNCYDGSSPWFGNGFHNFAIADVDMDGRDEIMFGSMCIDDTGFGLATTGLGHGDAQHCGDLDPYRWGLEQFTCQEGSQGNSYWNPTTGQIYYRKSDGGDDGRSLAGNFTDLYPGGQGRSVSSGVIGLSCDKIINISGDAMSGNYANLNNRIFWDGDLLDEIFNSKNGANRAGTIFKWGGQQIASFDGISNNWTKCNPSAQGDILGDWREELVLRLADNSALRIYATTFATEYDIYTLWDDHVYRNGMAWQCVGYNQPPHYSFFLGKLEDITVAPPPLILQGRTEVENGATIQTTDDHLLISGYEDKTISVADGASPWVLTVNAPAWVQGSGSQQATSSTPKSPARTIINYTTTLTGGAFSGATRLVKQGEGTLVLPKVTEKYTGNTDVWNGTLQFDGTLESSPLWLNRHTALVSDGGSFLGGIKADYNATIYPGGKEKVGTITATTLNLGFGSRIVFDVSGTTVDQLNVNQLSIETKSWQNGPKYNTPIFEFVGADQLPVGRYELGTIGSVTGSVENILLEGFSELRVRFYLQMEDGKLYLVLEDMREAADLVWNGTSANHIWDLALTKNFLNDGVADYAASGDNVIFDDQAASTTVMVKGAVSPKSITFNNETKSYTLSGDSILGGPTIVKNGKGTVTIINENRTGATTINGGKLSVNALANNTGVAYGALGNVNQTITINDGGTLGFIQPVITDQLVNVNGEVAIDVPSSYSVTFNKNFRGATGVVTKTGGGSLTTGVTGSYLKLIIKQGTVNCSAFSDVDQLPATVEFQGGVLWGANKEDGNGITNRTNFVVPEGKTGEFRASYRGNYSGTLTGKGTFTPVSGGVRCYWNGDWSQFEGTIVPVANDGTNRQNKKSYTPTFNITNSKGFPKATLKLNEGQSISNQDPASANTSYNVSVGSVIGSGTLTGAGTYTIGSDNKDFSTAIGSESTIVKVGEGTMLVTTTGKLKKPVTVKAGGFHFYGSETAAVVSSAIVAEGTGSIVGEGLVQSLTMRTGSQLTPRSLYMEDNFGGLFPGTIKSTAAVNFNAGSTLNILINDAETYSTIEPRYLTMNGTVKVTLGEDYKPKAGDTFTLWTTTTFSGTPSYSLPQLPEGLYWNANALADKTGVLSITDDASVGIGRIAGGELVSCDVYTVGGLFVGSFEAQRGEVRAAVKQLGVQPGLYIVRIQAGRNFEAETVSVK